MGKTWFSRAGISFT